MAVQEPMSEATTDRDAAPLEPRLLAGALAIEAVLVSLVRMGDLVERFAAFQALYLAATLAWLGSIHAVRRRARARRGFKLVVGFAVLFRLTVLAGEPSLSDDVHRYVLDGAMTLAGLNPYRHAPAELTEPSLEVLAARVNHPTISTIYPPLAQGVFALAALVAPTPRGMRVALLLGEGLVLWALARLNRERSRPAAELVWAAWCPLSLVETGLGGHLDMLAIGLLVLGLCHVSQGRKNLSMLCLAASGSVKYFAAAVAIALWRRLGARRVTGVLGLMAIAYLPFLAAGPSLGRGLAAYAANWEFNSASFRALVGGLEATRLSQALEALANGLAEGAGAPALRSLEGRIHPRSVARAMAILAFLAAVALVGRRQRDPVRSTALLVYAFLLLTPTLHPWYVQWAVPFLAFVPSRAFLWLAATVPLAYWAQVTARRGGGWRESPWVLAVEFVPFAILLAWDLAERRRPALLARLQSGPASGDNETDAGRSLRVGS